MKLLENKQRCCKAINHGQCCCNRTFNFSVNGHPWVTGTSIMTKTGLFVCTSKERGDTSRSYMASWKHGACEEWTAVKPERKKHVDS